MPPIDTPIRWKSRDAERVDERLGVGGQHRAGIGPGRRGARADAPVVEPQHPVAGRQEVVHLERPGLEVVSEAVDQDDGLLAVAFQPVVAARCPLTVATAIEVSLGSELDAGVQLAEHLLGQREVLGRELRAAASGVPRDDRLGQRRVLVQRAVPDLRRVGLGVEARG